MKAQIQLQLERKQPVLGTWSIVANATLAEIASLAGLEFLILDLEHGPYDFGALESAIRACESAGSAPLVRVPSLDPSIFQRVLDLGAHGVVVPQITGRTDVERAVAYAKYAPVGTRGYNPFVRAAAFAGSTGESSGKLQTDFGLVCVIIENTAGYAELDQILSVSGLDAVYLGTYDISMALGCNGNTKDPRVLSFVADAGQRIVSAGKALGMMVRTQEEIEQALDLGATMLVYGVDAHVIHEAWRQPVENFMRIRDGRKKR